MQNKIKPAIIQSTSYNPWYNLALEEYLMNKIKQGEIILYLWQNDNTVVIGKNQNAWKECHWKKLEKDGGKLARRSSGGGAVYHDLGNLNYTFVMDKEIYDLEKQMQVIIDALNKFGVKAKFSGRNDLISGKKKISGNAFYQRKNVALHHGTLLISTELEKLNKYLQVSKEKISSKGIDSIQARVANLSDIEASITINKMATALKESFINHYGEIIDELKTNKDIPKLNGLYQKYSSWEWRFGNTPDFDILFETRFSWGEIQLGLNLKEGIINSVTIYSDAMNCSIIDRLTSVLEDIPFQLDTIIDHLEKVKIDKKEEQIIKDIKNWLAEKDI
ncbi:lipoate--protein ligase [Halanaerobaculum tunisiense]